MADVVQQDKVGLAKEFEDAPAPPQEQAPQGEPQKFSREIDVGGRMQRFEAESYEALVDKLVEAQTHATKKLQELSQERKQREPEKTSSDWQEVRPSRLSQEDVQQLGPHELMRRVFQAETGLTFEEFRNRENQQRKWQAESAAQDAFVRKHPDYHPTQENAQKIMRLLEREGLPVSKRNLDWAFEEIRGELAPKAEAPAARAEPERPVVQPERPVSPEPQPKTSTPPSFIRPSLGGPVEREGGGQEAEIARIAQSSSLPEMKARIEQYFRTLRTSAR
jgi:hypothetical protein